MHNPIPYFISHVLSPIAPLTRTAVLVEHKNQLNPINLVCHGHRKYALDVGKNALEPGMKTLIDIVI